MKRILTVLADVFEGVDMSVIDVQEGIRRKFYQLVSTSLPFFYGNIKLI